MDCAMKVVHIGLLEEIPFAIDQFRKNKEFIDIFRSCAPNEGSLIRFCEKYQIKLDDCRIESDTSIKEMQKVIFLDKDRKYR